MNGLGMERRSDPRAVAPARRRFGQIALQRGYVSPQTLLECLEEQTRSHLRNDTPLRIGQILLLHGAITLDQLTEIIRTQKRTGGRKAVPASTEPLRQLGPFTIVRRIGSGGMSVVYRAVDRRDGLAYALKVLTTTPLNEEEDLLRLQREAGILKRLRHPNIVSFRATGSVPGATELHYLAMELVEGESLQEALPRLSLAEKLGVLEAIAGAVGHAHSLGIIHRDLKPGNIILARNGRPLLIDFGLAYDLTEARRLTIGGGILGTPLYLAPELVHGEEEPRPSLDVWGLGVILYEILAGSPPFGHPSWIGTNELYQQILENDPPTLRLPPSRSLRNLERVCRTALHKDPNQRYPTAGEFAAAMRLNRFP